MAWAAAALTAWASRSAVNGAGGGATWLGASLGGAASRRITAWKWMAPRAWYSATLTKATRTVRCSPAGVMPAAAASARRR